MGAPRVRKDWVFRAAGARLPDPEVAIGLGDPEVLSADLGSYDPAIITMASGIAAANAAILYDSQNRIAFAMGSLDSETQTHTWLTRAARAEGRRAKIFATTGFLHMEPSTWTLGNVMAIGWRLGKFTQDPESGFIEVPFQYSMWESTNSLLTPFTSVAQYANDGNWVKENRILKVFSSGDEAPQLRVPINWRSSRGITLRPNECWAVYLEIAATAVQMRHQRWLKSLVADEG